MTARRILGLFLCFTLVLTACDFSFEPNETASGERVTIAYAEAISSYSPLDFEAKNRKYLANIYEPLVRYDKSFNYDTGLSVAWGRLDDLTWEFKLREGVKFHDGSEFAADDAIYSLEIARADPESQLVSLLSTIAEVNEVNSHKIQVRTFDPDPLLLNKLTNVLMVPAAYEDFLAPMGTGPFYVGGFENQTLQLKRNPSYWGAAPFYEEVNMEYIQGVEDRLNAVLDGSVQVLANVPPQFVGNLESADIGVAAFPSLEVSYLMFNFERAFASDDLREVVWYGLGTDYAKQFGEGFLLPTDQYAASGIFGYNPSIEERAQDLERAKEARARYEGPTELVLDIPAGLSALGDRIAEDLAIFDLQVTVNEIPVDEFEKKILSGQSDFYFFGWKYDLADVSDFYETTLHTSDGQYGSFNGLQFSHLEVDRLVEEAATVLDVQERREVLNQIAEILLSNHVALPLFEAQVIYGIRPEVHWSVRLDGQILASEIIGNVVQ